MVQFFIVHYLYELNHLDDKEELDKEDVVEIERNSNFEVPLRADVRKMLEKLKGFFVKKFKAKKNPLWVFRTALFSNKDFFAKKV